MELDEQDGRSSSEFVRRAPVFTARYIISIIGADRAGVARVGPSVRGEIASDQTYIRRHLRRQRRPISRQEPSR